MLYCILCVIVDFLPTSSVNSASFLTWVTIGRRPAVTGPGRVPASSCSKCGADQHRYDPAALFAGIGQDLAHDGIGAEAVAAEQSETWRRRVSMWSKRFRNLGSRRPRRNPGRGRKLPRRMPRPNHEREGPVGDCTRLVNRMKSTLAHSRLRDDPAFVFRLGRLA